MCEKTFIKWITPKIFVFMKNYIDIRLSGQFLDSKMIEIGMILYFKCFNALAVLYRSMLKELDFLLNSEGHHFKWTEFG